MSYGRKNEDHWRFHFKLMFSEGQWICGQLTRMRRKGAKSIIIAFCGAVASTSVQRCVDVSGSGGILTCMASQKQISYKVSGCQGLLYLLVPLYKTLAARHSKTNNCSDWCCRPVSDLGQHMKSGPNMDWKDLLPCDLCCSHCYEKNRSESHMRK